MVAFFVANNVMPVGVANNGATVQPVLYRIRWHVVRTERGSQRSAAGAIESSDTTRPSDVSLCDAQSDFNAAFHLMKFDRPQAQFDEFNFTQHPPDPNNQRVPCELRPVPDGVLLRGCGTVRSSSNRVEYHCPERFDPVHDALLCRHLSSNV